MKIIGFNEKKKKKKYNRYYKFTCDHCGCIYIVSTEEQVWIHNLLGHDTTYCPNCGTEVITWFLFNHKIKSENLIVEENNEK